MSDLGSGILYTMKATEDVLLEGENNHVDGDILVVSSPWGYPKIRTLVRFDDIPSNCTTIHWAKMYLYFFCYSRWHISFDTVPTLLVNREAPYIPRPLQVHQVKEPWKESQATSDYRLSGVPWSKPYLGLDGSDAMEHPMNIVTIFTGRPFGYVEFDITEAALNWKAGEPNYGVVLSAVNEDVCGCDTRFYSHRHSEHQPFMTVFSSHQY
jgi:hypothetical protein